MARAKVFKSGEQQSQGLGLGVRCPGMLGWNGAGKGGVESKKHYF